MIEINLLPWREIKREQEKKTFFILLGSSLVSALAIAFFINYYAQYLIDHQNERNQRLQQEISIFDQKIAAIKQLKKVRVALISRMKIVQNLQIKRSLTVHLFDELIKVIPNGVYLTKVTRAQDKIILEGYAESNSKVSELMRNIQTNPWIQDPELTEIKKNKDATTDVNNEFNLSFILQPQNKGFTP